MATTQIYLLKPVEHLGHEGELVTVKAGYARNFLLPRGFAMPLSRGNRKQIEALERRKEERLRTENAYAEAMKAKLEAVTIAISVKTGEGGRMFGSITANDLLARLAEEGIQIDKKQLSLYSPVKALGKHTTRIRLNPQTVVDLTWEVVSENPIEVPVEDAASKDDDDDFPLDDRKDRKKFGKQRPRR